MVEDERSLIGFAVLRPTRDSDQDPVAVGEISSFYVAPHAWNRGAGRQLMNAAVSALASAGYASATLWVLATNTRAMRFYGSSGWLDDDAVKTDTIAGVAVRELRYRHDLRRE